MVKENKHGKQRSYWHRRRRLMMAVLLVLTILAAVVKTASRLHIGNTPKALKMTKKVAASNPAAVFDSHHPQERAILEGKYFLIDIDVMFGALSSKSTRHNHHHTNTNKTDSNSHYGAVTATFCPLDWRLQKTSPATVPMFRVLVAQSTHCASNRVTMDLREIVKKARLYDKAAEEAAAKRKSAAAEAAAAGNKKKSPTPGVGGIIAGASSNTIPSTPVKTLQLGGFVFHESRCGSTLVSNLLVASNPQAHRVYSESSPPITALRACPVGDLSCSIPKQTSLLHDVVYLMSRSQARDETHVFFKIQSVGAHSMAAITQHAFPTTPWIFVYRDPVEVIMSHLKHGGDAAKKAVCLRTKGRSPVNVVQLIKDKAPQKELKDLTNVEYCAAHLATLCQSALKVYHADDGVDVDHPEEQKKKKDSNDEDEGNNNNNNSNNKGKMVNYASLPDIMWESILPDHFDMDLPSHTTEMVDRMKAMSQVYSKAFKGDRPWEQDSERKQDGATNAMKKAATLFLTSYFEQMEATNNGDNNDGEENDDATTTNDTKNKEDVDAEAEAKDAADFDADVAAADVADADVDVAADVAAADVAAEADTR
mmetsp:Transcript_16967/g.28177  ORF Transcript_16967/g.28177 Transcript_16967/m.28177 type:complete len:594 (+) Transcript_16967:164-1945(+)|eukprot:CAMPEP_0119008982 /NCGR_PEP_ID=MMETSP1176-20130426/4062_1 /TAXON_ID=265551 /ORGANISM="Synedropsis recta cf, Strain CCMP1620" /LENGTH=593 /DNA_ID=CAMNT_0006961405 /DNA_START=159 /DNA_END=1940 /DNA_ORIENTATION=-